MSTIVFDPAEGLRLTADWAWHLKNNGGSGGEDKSTGRKHTILAGCTGTVTSVGGGYGEVVIKLDDGSGRSVRTCEHATILVRKGQVITDPFTPIAQDALYRAPYYRDTHFNGIAANGARIPFSEMVTHTQSAARIALTPDPLEAFERLVLKGADANVRSKPVVKADNLIRKVKANTQIRPLGYVFGEIRPDGNALWYVLAVDADGYPVEFLWSGGTTDVAPHDLQQMQERPTTTPTPEIPADEQDNPPLDPPVIVDPEPALHSVGFDTRIDGSSITSYEVKDGEAVAPPTPSWAGHVFEGWFDSAGAFTVPFDFAEPITRDYLLVAVWTTAPVEPEPEPPAVDGEAPVKRPTIRGIVIAGLVLAAAAAVALFKSWGWV
jgi:hypothetical protein